MEEHSDPYGPVSVEVRGWQRDGGTVIEITLNEELPLEGIEHLVYMLRGNTRLLCRLKSVRSGS